MKTKVIYHSYPGIPKNEWVWPDNDNLMWRGTLEGDKDDQTRILKYVRKRRVCIQAGGACGVWPYRFSLEFDRVHTFEPHPENWFCLMQNIAGRANIYAHNRALGALNGRTRLIHPAYKQPDNHGVFYISDTSKDPVVADVEVITIDSLQLDGVDLIQLDIEGGEQNALLGAAETIRACHPVIVLENKPLRHLEKEFRTSPRLVSKFVCDTFDYHQAGRVEKDSIYMWNGHRR